MPDGTRQPALRVEECARLMTRVTRHWAELDASGPRAGPVREAITDLEPVVFAQMIVAMDHWLSTIDDTVPDDGPAARLRKLADQVLAGGADDPDLGPPHLTSIDFVQLWPQVIRQMREQR